MGESGKKMLLVLAALFLAAMVGVYFLWVQSKKIDSEDWALYESIEQHFGAEDVAKLRDKNQAAEQYRMVASAAMGGYYLIDFGVLKDGTGILSYKWHTPHDFEKGSLAADETKKLTAEETQDITHVIEGNNFFARPASEFRKKGTGSQMQDVEIIIEGVKEKKHNAIYGRVLMEKSPVFAIAEALFFFADGVETPFWRDKPIPEETEEPEDATEASADNAEEDDTAVETQ